jgi:hypothetical protein
MTNVGLTTWFEGRKMRRGSVKAVVVAAGSLLLVGCWQTRTDFYDSEALLTPFQPGPVTATDSDGKVTRSTLTLNHGVYSLAMGTDAAFRLRFFRLTDAPADTFVAEMEFVNCKDGVCASPSEGASHYFALARRTRGGGAEELAANCDDSATAQKLGAKQVGGMICEFSDRATLEKALLTLTGTKPIATVNPQ